jgi:hypothetical protein
MKTSTFLRSSGPVLLLVLAIGLFDLSTVRPGHDWGDDFALYIMQARDIVQGGDYARTGYIFNRYYPSLAPRSYPPGFPLLLAPVFKVYGLDLEAFKAEIIVFFAAALVVLFFFVRRRLPAGYGLLVVALLGLNPTLWSFKDSVLSDLPFLFFLFLALLIRDGLDRSGQGRHRQFLPAVACGVLGAVCLAVRSIGLVLIPAFFVQDYLRFKRPSRITWTAAASFGAVFLPQMLIFRGAGSYLEMLRFDPPFMLKNLVFYADRLATFWTNGRVRIIAYGLAAGLTLLAVIGYRALKKEGWTIIAVFFWIYLAVLVVLPVRQDRFLFPAVGLYLLLAMKGLHLTASRVRNGKWLTAGALGAFVLGYGLAYAGIGLKSPIPEGPCRPESVALFDFIKKETGPGDIFIFRKPKALALFAGRPSSTYAPASDGSLWAYFREIGARYIVVSRMLPPDREFLAPFVERQAGRLDRVYANADFRVYRIR